MKRCRITYAQRAVVTHGLEQRPAGTGGLPVGLDARLLRRLGIHHKWTRPCTPRTNGKAERFIQTALREWAYARSYDHSDQRAAHLNLWLHEYNWHRRHASLSYQPPISRIPLAVKNLLGLHL